MNKKHRKQVKVAMAVALAATSTTYSIGNLFAQSEDTVSENTLIDTIEENVEAEIEILESKENVKNVEKVTGDIEINETNFPDPVFREYIRTGYPDYNTKIPFDTNQDGILSSDEIDNITRIEVKGRANLTSVQGIEYFPNLTYLDCSDTGITELDVSKNLVLETLRCSNTGITKLDVSNNTALEGLFCYFNAGITELDVSNNPALRYLTCFNTGIAELDVSKNLELRSLDLGNTNITSIDVSNNPELYTLYCYGTGVTELDVSNNPALLFLYCYDTGITKLDVSNNPKLSELACSDTGIKELDVSNNPELAHLFCQNTGITSLEVSNTMLRDLNVSGNNLAWMNIGDKPNLYDTGIEDSNIDLGEVEDTFNITEVFPGMDLSNITVTSGASLDKATGIVSGYTNGTPITYTYYCGTSMNGVETLPVTLHFKIKKQSSSIIINDDLNKVYDGQAVAEPQVTVTGSKGAVTFEWYQKEETATKAVTWTKLATAPSAVGEYKVVVTVAEDENYTGLTVEQEFSILENNVVAPAPGTGVQTGDGTQAGLWTMLVGVSTGLMMYFRKKNRKEEV